MIQDPEFWQRVQQSPNGRVALPLLAAALHKALTPKHGFPQPTTGLLLSPSCRSPQAMESSQILTPSAGRSGPASLAPPLSPSALTSSHEPFQERQTPQHHSLTPTSSSSRRLCRSVNSTKPKVPSPFDISGPPVSQAAIRVLQHTMMYYSPLYTLRYNIPAMSMSWNSACVVDANSHRLVTFGSISANVPVHLKCKSCVAGDSYFAVLTDKDEVWVSGSLDTGSGGTPILDNTENMRGVAAKILMIAGHGSRLIAVTKALTVRPLSIVPLSTRSLLPSRLVRFVDVGFGDDCYMIGVDSIIYKTTISHRNVTTPRRVMTLSRLAVSRVASGSGFHLILDETGRLFTVGKNKRGQLGNGMRQDSMRRPYLVSSLESHFLVQVAAGDAHSLVLASSGVVYGCGSHDNGQLGMGESAPTEVTRFTKITIPGGGKCIGITAGPIGSMFAMDDGRVMVCGGNEYEQLGLGAAYSIKKIVWTPTAVPKTVISKIEMHCIDFSPLIRSSEFGAVSPMSEASFFANSITTPNTATNVNAQGTSGGKTFDGRGKMPLAAKGKKEKTDSTKCCSCCSLM